MTALPPKDDRYFEDYPQGAPIELGTLCVSKEEVIAFAERYDPQAFHIDEQAADASHFGGLIASGWHTGSMFMRVLVDEFVSPVAGMGSPGIDELRWLEPVRPDDVLSVRVTVTEKRRSRTKPDRGIMKTFGEVTNQRGVTVMTIHAMSMVRCREVKI
ncbi:MAG: MaoC family dehydratase [Pseudomonadota bacterium]